ncbi:MAG: L,D-transpeptidase [Myxococcales bacterium]|nr:L,D-transpeptidase [Myxococcales bacterium]
MLRPTSRSVGFGLLLALVGPGAWTCACKGAHDDADAPALAASEPAASPPGAGADGAASGQPSASGSAVPEIPVVAGSRRVDLDGAVHAPPPLPPGRVRLAALGWVTPVQKKPDPGASRLGTLRAGAVVAASPEVAGTTGCPGGWHAVEPAGYVCVGEGSATLAVDHPVVSATRPPDFTRRLPYMYGVVTRGGPLYARVPSQADLAEHEPNLDKHLQKWRDDAVSGARYGLDVWLRWTEGTPPDALAALAEGTTGEAPFFLRDGGVGPNVSGLVKSPSAVKVDEAKRRTGRSFIHSFLSEGRRYNVTPDLLVAPADRFRPIRGSEFHGFRVAADGATPEPEAVRFPFALVRREGARKWRWDGKKMADDGPLAWRSAVLLTGKQKFHGKVLHFETVDGFWVDDRHAGRTDPAKKWPKWAKNGQKWIDVNITKQTLVAYEGMRAVYTTLVSSGEAGLADAEDTTATKKGIFRVHTKFVSVTMDSKVVGEEFELRDVPYVQYFEEGYALHGAYWHDKFGSPKSHGCINLSPEDARRLFFWTDPPVPAGWHSAAEPLTGTVVFVHP